MKDEDGLGLVGAASPSPLAGFHPALPGRDPLVLLVVSLCPQRLLGGSCHALSLHEMDCPLSWQMTPQLMN